MLASTFISSACLWLSLSASTLAAVANTRDSLIEERHVPHPVHIPAELFAKFERYANFSSASTFAEGDCPYPPYGAVLAKYLNIASTTTQASLFRDDAEKEFILAFPGTNGAEDSKLDSEHHLTPYITKGVPTGKCQNCMTHTGFLKAWNSIVDLAATTLEENVKMYPDYKITITGHSLGGALSSLATSSLKGLGFKIDKTYSFGQPRTGNQEYADHIDEISGAHRGKHSPEGDFHRVTHANDGVPQVPKQSAGYRHHRTEYWEYSMKNETAHRVVRCWGQEPANCNNAHPAPTLFVAAHGYYGGIEIGDPASCGM